MQIRNLSCNTPPPLPPPHPISWHEPFKCRRHLYWWTFIICRGIPLKGAVDNLSTFIVMYAHSPFSSLTHTHSHPHTYLSHTHTHTHTLSHTLSLTHTLSNTHFLTHSLPHPHSHIFSHSPFSLLTHTHSHTHIHLTHTHPLIPSLSHTPTFSHTPTSHTFTKCTKVQTPEQIYSIWYFLDPDPFNVSGYNVFTLV